MHLEQLGVCNALTFLECEFAWCACTVSTVFSSSTPCSAHCEQARQKISLVGTSPSYISVTLDSVGWYPHMVIEGLGFRNWFRD